MSEPAALQWNPFNLHEYLKNREGQVWQPEDTFHILERAQQIDDLMERLLRAAGFEVVE
jgi:hypothetical protein